MQGRILQERDTHKQKNRNGTHVPSSREEVYPQALSGSLQSEQALAEVEVRYDVSESIPRDDGFDRRQDIYASSCYPTYQISNDFQYHNIFSPCDLPSGSQSDSVQFLLHEPTNDAGALTDAFDPHTQAWNHCEISSSNSSSFDFSSSGGLYDPMLSTGPWDYLFEPYFAESGSFELQEEKHEDWTPSLTNGLCSPEASQDSATPSENLSATPCSWVSRHSF